MQHANDNHTGLRFLSVCSGIEAASVAWHPLGWQCIGVAEIEPFPAFVLAHHYGAGRPKYMPNPGEPGIKLKDQRSRKTALKAVSRLPVESVLTNWGDFTKIDTKTLGRVDILAGGTPCQAFSVAGLRQSLADARGNLSLEFVRLAHELAANNGLRNVVWENVVGVLSTKDNAFGCFLAGLVGADSPIEPPRRGKWARHGMVTGPKGRAAWAVKDGQFFGVAQRRRRVLVVADFGNGADPAAVLFEPESMFRDTPPSREKGKDVAPKISARTKGGGGLGTDFDLDGGLRVQTFDRQSNSEYGEAGIASTVSARDYKSPTDLVAHAIQAGALRTNPNSGPDGVGVQEGVAYTLEARAEVQAVCVTGDVAHTLKAEGADASVDGTGRGTPIVFVPETTPTMVTSGDGNTGFRDGDGIVAFDTSQITSPLNRSMPKVGEPCHPLNAQAHAPAIAFQSSQSGVRVGDVHATLDSNNGSRRHNGAVVGPAVRRLTPVECERLQGFTDDYTDIPWRGKPNSPDGPRYKALGNSWAVPKFVWLGQRIQKLMPANDNSIELNQKRAA